MCMYVARIPNRGSPPAILLRENYREAGKVKSRTLANLTRWPAEKLEALEAVLKGLPPTMGLERAFEVAPGPKLATARGLRAETASSSLGKVLGVSRSDEDDLYDAMDWLLERQGRVEDALAARHLSEGTLVLYDVSSAAFEGRCCPLAKIGYARDGVKGRAQVVYGLLTNKDGVPVAVEVFEGSTGDPGTVAAQVQKVKQRFGLSHVVLVGDRGMLTMARIDRRRRPRRPRVGHGPTGAHHKVPGRGGPPATIDVRPNRPGRDNPPRLPRRAPGALPGPCLGC